MELNQSGWSVGSRAVLTCHALALVLLSGRLPATRSRISDMGQKWRVVVGVISCTTFRTSGACLRGVNVEEERRRRPLGRRRILQMGESVSFSDESWPWRHQSHDG